ncbi:uncharacterized protein METZ01_LOCUS424684, partial [marine metagenome]
AVVRIAGEDSFALDDSREIWLKAPPPRRFGFLAGTDDVTQLERDFLEAVLESAGDSAWDRWIFSQENANSLLEGNEEAALDVLLMPGMQNLEDAGHLEFLLAFMEDGGVVLATPGKPFAATIANLRETGLLELGFKGVPSRVRDRSDPFRFASFSPGTALAKVFEGKPARDLQLASLYKYGEIEANDQEVTVRVRAANKHPLVLERKIGAGRLLFFAFRLDTAWSDLPARNSFLPLLVELVKGEGGEDRSWPHLEVGERLVAGGGNFLG